MLTVITICLRAYLSFPFLSVCHYLRVATSFSSLRVGGLLVRMMAMYMTQLM